MPRIGARESRSTRHRGDRRQSSDASGYPECLIVEYSEPIRLAEVVGMVSDRGLQQIIGAALFDSQVRSAIFERPLALADRFDLSIPERRFMVNAQPRNLEHFATLVEGWSTGEPPLRQRIGALRQTARLAG